MVNARCTRSANSPSKSRRTTRSFGWAARPSRDISRLVTSSVETTMSVRQLATDARFMISGRLASPTMTGMPRSRAI